MNDNYCDILESYLIPAMDSKSENKFSLYEKMTDRGIRDTIDKERVNNVRKSIEIGPNHEAVKEEFKKNRESKSDAEWDNEFNKAAIKDMINKYKWKNINIDRALKYFEEKGWKTYKYSERKPEKKDNIYHFKFDAKKALPYSNIIYPENKFKTAENLVDSMEKDLKIALRKILSSQEVNNAFNALCKDYNEYPKGDAFDDRFRFDAPDKLNINWLKSQFTVENFEEDKDEVYFLISKDQDFTIWIGNEIVYALGDYIENMYQNYIYSLGYGDGDEGCIYIRYSI